MHYKIIAEYRYSEHSVLAVEHIQDITGLTCFGTFEMNLLNADEIGLDLVADNNIIQEIMKSEYLFTEISNENLEILLTMHKADTTEGMYIESV